MGPLYVEWDSASYVGQIFPNDDGAAGIGTLVTCTAGPGGTNVELLRFEVGDCP